MLIVLAKITAKDGMVDNILNETKTLIEATRNEEGCIEYNLYNSTEKKNILTFVEKWDSKESLEAHVKQAHFIDFGSAIENYLAKDLEISVYSSEEITL